MPEMGTSGLMSGDGKRGDALRVSTRARPRLYLRRASARQSGSRSILILRPGHSCGLGEETIMRSNRMRVLVAGAAALGLGVYAENIFSKEKEPSRTDPAAVAVDKGIKWLVSVQGSDGGWGQDGGETS